MKQTSHGAHPTLQEVFVKLKQKTDGLCKTLFDVTEGSGISTRLAAATSLFHSVLQDSQPFKKAIQAPVLAGDYKPRAKCAIFWKAVRLCCEAALFIFGMKKIQNTKM